tara:strand:- start:256 stop:525 length:270 start_codon:yes stop_codon:yes gene_type:complete
MSWQEEIKKYYPIPVVFQQLTDKHWHTNVSFNDLGILSKNLDDYAEEILPDGDDRYMEMKEFAKEIDGLERKLEDVLIETRELLLDIGK